METGKKHLNSFQSKILKEALGKKSGGLCLPMGSGKTFLSIMLGLQQSKNRPILIVVSKTLIESWCSEIKKFFKDTLNYTVFHQDYSQNWDNEKIVITTPEMVVKHYKSNDIQDLLVSVGNGNIKVYSPPDAPFLQEGSPFYSVHWGSLIIDEMQTFTNIQSLRCEALVSIYSEHRWGLSGTMFAEPKVERIMGYFLLIGDSDFPNNLPQAKRHVRTCFRGISRTIVFRGRNEAFLPPKVNNVIVDHTMSEEEEKIYLSMKTTLSRVDQMVKRFIEQEDHIMARKFSAYRLSMLTILRQSVICPLLPIASVAVDLSNLNNKSELSALVQNQLDSLKISDWLNDVDSVKSSRIKQVVRCVDLNPQKIVIFTSFRSCLDIINHFMPGDRECFTLCSEMSSAEREKTIDGFRNSSGGILLLTFQLGAEGLNLQFCNTVFLVDYWWNSGKTDQAIARVLRYGQLSKQVNVYYFTSNTGVEAAIFGKHSEKINILSEMQNGPITKSVKPMQISKLISFIDSHDAVGALKMANLSI